MRAMRTIDRDERGVSATRAHARRTRAPESMASTSGVEGVEKRGRKRRGRALSSTLARALGVASLAALFAHGDAKPKLTIVRSGNDIAHASHVLCGVGAIGKEKCHDYEEMLTPYADAKATLERAFAEVAKRYSECPTGSEGGDLGYFPRGDMAKDFERVVFDPKTPLDKVVGPVETRNGWHLIMVHSRHLADEEAKELAREKQETMRQERLERAEKQREYQEQRELRRQQRLKSMMKERDDVRHSLHHDEF